LPLHESIAIAINELIRSATKTKQPSEASSSRRISLTTTTTRHLTILHSASSSLANSHNSLITRVIVLVDVINQRSNIITEFFSHLNEAVIVSSLLSLQQRHSSISSLQAATTFSSLYSRRLNISSRSSRFRYQASTQAS